METVEIPSDRSSWGPFVQLVDIAEEQVHAIIEELAATDAAPGSEAQKIGDLFASFTNTAAIDAAGLTPVRPMLEAAQGVRDVRDLAAFLGELERIGGRGLFGSYVDSDD